MHTHCFINQAIPCIQCYYSFSWNFQESHDTHFGMEHVLCCIAIFTQLFISGKMRHHGLRSWSSQEHHKNTSTWYINHGWKQKKNGVTLLLGLRNRWEPSSFLWTGDRFVEYIICISSGYRCYPLNQFKKVATSILKKRFQDHFNLY